MSEFAFVQVCVCEHSRQRKMVEMWHHLQHLPGATWNRERKYIDIEGVLVYMFVLQSFEPETLHGIRLKGFGLEHSVGLTRRQHEFLASRIR